MGSNRDDAPTSVREALYELGFETEGQQRDHLSLLVMEAGRLRRGGTTDNLTSYEAAQAAGLAIVDLTCAVWPELEEVRCG